MTEDERLAFLDRQCLLISALICDAERESDRAWAANLYHMADQLTGAVAHLSLEGPISPGAVARFLN